MATTVDNERQSKPDSTPPEVPEQAAKRGRWPIARLLVIAPILIVGSINAETGHALPWLNAHVSLGWACVLALAIVSYSACYAFVDGSLGMNFLGLTLVPLCGYLLLVLSGYTESAVTARRLTEALWWTIPVTIAAWSSTSYAIASATARAGEGVPAAPSRAAGLRAVWHRHRDAGRWIFGVYVWIPASVFGVLGAVPGVIWREQADGGGPAWDGHPYAPTAVYYLVAGWAVSLFILAWVVLLASYRARPGGLRLEEDNRAWFYSRASAVVIVLYGMLAAGDTKIWAEPLLDLALALYAAGFVFLLAQANAAARSPRLLIPLRWRSVRAIGFAAVAVCLGVLFGKTPFSAGLGAMLLAGYFAFQRMRVPVFRQGRALPDIAVEPTEERTRPCPRNRPPWSLWPSTTISATSSSASSRTADFFPKLMRH